MPRVTYILAERGSCFALWKDTIDNLSDYRVAGPAFHTMCLSTGTINVFLLSREIRRIFGMQFILMIFSLFFSPMHRSYKSDWLQFWFESGSTWNVVIHRAFDQWPRKYIAECAGTQAKATETTKASFATTQIPNISTVPIFTCNQRYHWRFTTVFQHASVCAATDDAQRALERHENKSQIRTGFNCK